jgi:hypothetical protein
MIPNAVPSEERRRVVITEALRASVADDSKAAKLHAIHLIACMSSDYRVVYCDAVKRVIELQKGRAL